MKGILSIAAIAALFFTVLLGGGRLLGVWEELTPPPTSAATDRAVRTLASSATAKMTARKTKRRAGTEAPRAAGVRWIRGANELCRSARAETIGMDEPKTLAEAEAVISHVAERNRSYNARVLALRRPPGERARAKIARLAKLLAAEEALIDRVFGAIRSRDAMRILALSDRLVALGERESALLVELGANDCAL